MMTVHDYLAPWMRGRGVNVPTNPVQVQPARTGPGPVTARDLLANSGRHVMTGPGEHMCVADDCPVLVPHWHPMCLPHWNRVPGRIRKRVRVTYQEGEPTQEYLRAVLDAVEAVRNKAIDPWHHCPLGGCGRRIPGRVVVCRNCWKALPSGLQRKVSGLRTAPGYAPPAEVVAAVLEEASRIVQQARTGSGAEA